MSSLARGILIVALQALWVMTAPAAMAQDMPGAAPKSVQREVIAVVPKHWPPQYDVDAKGNPVGFAIDVMNEIVARAGFGVTYRVVDNFAAVEDAMAAGQGDIIPNSGITPARSRDYSYTAPVQASAISIIVRVGTTGIQGLADLAGRRVGIVERSVGENIVEPYKSAESVMFKDSVSALFGLLAGQVDALIYARSVIAAMAREAGVEDRITTAGEPVLEVKRAIRVQKNKPEILAALDKAVNDFVGTPEYRRIYAKWYGKPLPFWTRSRILWTAGGVIVAILIAFAVLRYRLIVRMNRHIAASEEKFRDLIEGAVPGVLIHRDHRPLFVNRSYARIFGYDGPDELMHQPSALYHVAPHERARLRAYAVSRLSGRKVPAVYEFQGVKKDGTRIWLENRGRVVDWEGAPAIQRTVVDITEKRQAEAELMLRHSQQAVVAELGQRALVDDDLESLVNTAVRLVATFLQADLCGFLELAPDGKELLLRAGIGWKSGVVGKATVSAGPDSQAGFTLLSREPVVVEDWRAETRFATVPPILGNHGVHSGVTAIIGDPDRPFGVLSVHTKSPRAFSADDTLFLKTVSIMLASAIARKRGSDAIHASEERLRGAIQSLQEGFSLYDANDCLVMINDQYREFAPGIDEFLTKGSRFEEIIRTHVENGLIADAAGRGEEFIRERLEQFRTLAGPIVRRHSNGKWFVIKQARTPEGGTALTFSDITGLKRAEEALRDSREQFRAVVNASPSAITMKDREGRFLLVNRAFADWLGAEPADIVGKTVEELFPEQDEEIMALDRKIYATGQIMTSEMTVAYGDGRTREVLLTKGPVRSAAGGIVAVCTIVTDMTDLKRADEALRKSEALFRTVVNHSPTKIHIKDVEGRYTLLNKEAEKLFGVSDADGRGKTSFDLFPKEVADAFMAHDRAVIESRRSVEKEEAFVIDGEEHTYLTVKFPIFDGDRVSAVGAIGTDISKRKREERKFRSLLQSAPDAMVIVDDEGRIQLINRQAEKLFGYRQEELKGKNVECLVPPDLRNEHVGHRKGYSAATRTRPMGVGLELCGLTKDGREIPVEISLGPIPTEDGLLVAAAIKDVTARKAAEKKMFDLQAELAHVSRISTMGELAAGLAHELNQPLTAITNYAKGTLRRLHAGGDSVDLLPIMELVAEQALRAGEIIRKIRGFMNRSEPRKTRIHLGRTIDEVMSLMAGEINMSAIEVALDVPKSLPPVMADSIQIQQVLLNLIRNAVAAMAGDGSNHRLLEIGATANGTKDVEIYVRDSGPGIPPDLNDRLFEPFFTTKTDGLGMGLSISRSIVSSHNGRIWVSSEAGKGATFHFTLPTGTDVDHDAP